MAIQIPVALQLYSVREDCARDLAGVLGAVARMGYAGVEFAGTYGHGAADLRRILEAEGLRPAGAHTKLDELVGDAFAPTADFHLTLGNRFLVVPSLPRERRGSRKQLLDTAKLLNDLAARASERGLMVGYHSHDFDFAPLDGETGWDLLAAHTAPEVVMQIDTGNALHGDADPVACLERHPGRARTIHLKDHDPDRGYVLLGEGTMPWQRLFDLCESVEPTEWYIVEQEAYPGERTPLECVAACRQSLADMGR